MYVTGGRSWCNQEHGAGRVHLAGLLLSVLQGYSHLYLSQGTIRHLSQNSQ